MKQGRGRPKSRKHPRFYKKYRWMIDITEKPHHPEYPKYGGRGQTCYWTNGQYREFEHWLLSTLGEPPSSKHQLCRIDKTGNFEPRNLAWMLPIERSNSNTVQNIVAKYGRQQKTLASWARELDIPYWSLRRRFARGMTIKEIVKDFE